MKKVTADRLTKEFKGFIRVEVDKIEAKLRALEEIIARGFNLGEKEVEKIERDTEFPELKPKEEEEPEDDVTIDNDDDELPPLPDLETEEEEEKDESESLQEAQAPGQ